MCILIRDCPSVMSDHSKVSNLDIDGQTHSLALRDLKKAMVNAALSMCQSWYKVAGGVTEAKL